MSTCVTTAPEGALAVTLINPNAYTSTLENKFSGKHYYEFTWNGGQRYYVVGYGNIEPRKYITFYDHYFLYEGGVVSETSNYEQVSKDKIDNNTVIGLGLDIDNKLFTIITPTEYIELPFTCTIDSLGWNIFLAGGSTVNVDYITVNFGSTPFKYPIPKGYTSWDGQQGNVSRYLLKDNEGYKNLTELVSTEIPTEDQFKEKGMSSIPSYSQLSNFNDLVTYTTDSLSKSLVKFKPKAKTILSSGAINFSGKELKKVSLIGTDNARVLFSKDRGVTWYSSISNKIPITSATSNSAYYSDQSPDKTIDGDKTQQSGSYWHAVGNYPEGQNGYRLVLDLSVPTRIDKTIITAGVQYYWGNSGVKDFEIFGCNEIGKETLLYSGTALNLTGKNFVSTTTVIHDNTPYRYLIYNIKDSYTGSNYVIVTEVEVFGEPVSTSISDIPIHGLTPTQLAAITSEEWKAFMGDSSTLRVAYYLPDGTANTDKLELTVDFVGE